MAILIEQIWSNGINTTTPSIGKISTGFVCGDADPDIFNWILKLYGQGIVDLQGLVHDVAQVVGTADVAHNDAIALLNDKTGIATTSKAGIVKLANHAQTGIGNVLNGTATSDIVTMDTLHRFFYDYGGLHRLLINDDDNWQDITALGTMANNGATWIYDYPIDFDAKGFYLITVDAVAPGGNVRKYVFQWDVYWNDRGITPDTLALTQQGGVAETVGDIILESRCNLDTGEINLLLRASIDTGGSAATHSVSRVEKLYLHKTPLASTGFD